MKGREIILITYMFGSNEGRGDFKTNLIFILTILDLNIKLSNFVNVIKILLPHLPSTLSPPIWWGRKKWCKVNICPLPS